MNHNLIIELVLGAAFIATLAACFNLRAQLENAKNTMIGLRADRDSMRNMYLRGNPMSYIPPIRGMVSPAVLIDECGQGRESDYSVGYYNLNDKRWAFEGMGHMSEAEYAEFLRVGRWYPLPTKETETRRNSR